MVMRLTEQDHDLVTQAVAKVERESDGEVVTVVAQRSDAYHDVGLHYAVLAMLLVPALGAVVPQNWVDWWTALILGWNAEFSFRTLMILLFVKMAVLFLIVRYALAWLPLRMALTPGRTKSRRVRRRAIELFRTNCEMKTRGRTGLLLYVSLAERRAEIVADEAIATQVQPEVWGEAMVFLVDELKARRPGPGIAGAVERMGAVLTGILPPKPDNPNELEDRLVEL
jgi:putative membrane protein